MTAALRPAGSVRGYPGKIEGGTAVEETVTVPQVANTTEELPPRVAEALGELAGAAKVGLLALSAGVGLGVLCELMAEEVDEVVGSRASTTRSAPPCVTATRPG